MIISTNVMITVIRGFEYNTCDISYVNQYVVTRIRTNVYKKWTNQVWKEIIHQRDKIELLKRYYIIENTLTGI